MTERSGTGWPGIVLLTLAATLLTTVPAALLIVVPLAALLLAFPRERPLLALVCGALAFYLLGAPGDSSLAYIDRGWALLLAGFFTASIALLRGWSFFHRGVAAVAAALFTGGVLLSTRESGYRAFEWTLLSELRRWIGEALVLWRRVPSLEAPTPEFTAALYRAAEAQVLLFPAFLALGSVAGLAVAWWLFGRLRERGSLPLGSIRDFRFGHGLVWVAAVGLGLLVISLASGSQWAELSRVGASPPAEGAVAFWAGSNLLVFMAALFALRGTGVALTLIGSPGWGGALLAGFALLFLYPVVMTAAVVVGLTDTWVDLRARRAGAPGSTH